VYLIGSIRVKRPTPLGANEHERYMDCAWREAPTAEDYQFNAAHPQVDVTSA
jgi:hypothetical protein